MGAPLPVIYLPHGGGPWPFVDLGGFIDSRESAALASYLRGIPAALPEQPKALLVVSAHWEAPVPTVMTSPAPPILYDYYGFPEPSYHITWPAPGHPELAARVRSLLEGAGFATAADAERGFDHGTFIPLKLTFPAAEVPAIQLSLERGLDPKRHLALGRALAPLRDEGVLLVGSGMSFHNLRQFGRGRANTASEHFDAWLQRASVAEPAARDDELARWTQAPSAREAHPREEHLLPLMVVAGAAPDDRGRIAFSGTFGGQRISAIEFGG
jgi:aromatic ring-opening dioxygenase catalytic subunit (LigB family)